MNVEYPTDQKKYSGGYSSNLHEQSNSIQV